MTPMILVPAVPEVNAKGLAAIEQANAFDISAPGAREAIDAFCVSLKALEKEVDLGYDEHIDAAYKAHKSLVAKKKVYAEPIMVAYRTAKGKLIQIDDRDKAIAEQEAAISRAKAKRVAEDEALARAARAAEFGDNAAADAIITAPVIVEPVKVVAPVKTATVLQTRWKARIVDPMRVPREYCVPNEVAINAIARSTKGAIKIEGVEIYSERC